MSMTIKDLVVEDWVDGKKIETFIRINHLEEEKSESPDLNAFPEAIVKLKYLQHQYFSVLESNKSLEEQLYNAQCQIRALQVSNIYNSEAVSKDQTVETELKSVQKEIIENKPINKESYESLTKQNYFQKLIIDDLMCKLQNLHHRVEYYKEDVTELKTQYQHEKDIVEMEKKNQSIIQEQNQEALQMIEKLKQKIKILKKENLQIKKSKKIRTQIIIEKSDYQVDTENFNLESKFNDQINRLHKKYNKEILEIQQNNKSVLENLGLCMKKRIDELKNYYEFRINSMIHEYSHAEAKFHSKITTLKQEISEYLQKTHELENKINLSNKKYSIDRKKTFRAEQTISNLNSLLDKMSFQNLEIKSRYEKEIELLQSHTEDLSNDLRSQYHLQQRIAEESHQRALSNLKSRYSEKIVKIQNEFKTAESKLFVRDQKEHNVLLQEISRIESIKTEIEMRTESKVQEVVLEAKARYIEYENLLDHSKKEMLEQWDNDRKALKLEYEKNLEKNANEYEDKLTVKLGELHDYYQDKILGIEEIHSQKLKDLQKKYSAEITILKEVHAKDIEELKFFIERLNTENLRLLGKIGELNHEKDEILNEHQKEMQEEKGKYEDLNKAYNDLIQIKAKIQSSYEQKIFELNQTLIDKESVLKLKYETEKRIAILHLEQEKNDLESQYTKRLNDLSHKYEEIKSKYEKSKQQKSVLRFADTNTQRFTKELHDRDKIIENLKKERNVLQTSLDYLNSTVRIFSSQEKTFHAKNSSIEFKSSKNSTKTPKLNNSFKF